MRKTLKNFLKASDELKKTEQVFITNTDLLMREFYKTGGAKND